MAEESPAPLAVVTEPPTLATAMLEQANEVSRLDVAYFVYSHTIVHNGRIMCIHGLCAAVLIFTNN